MKSIFLISTVFLSLSLHGAHKPVVSTDSSLVVRVLGASLMPANFWSNASGDFKTLEDALDLAKVNALFYGLETPEATHGMASLCSAFSYITHNFLTYTKELDEASKPFLKNFIAYCSREDNDEGLAIQHIARELRKSIAVCPIKDVNRYLTWLSCNKNPKMVKSIVSCLDCYYQTEQDIYIDDLFEFVFKEVEKDLPQQLQA